MSPSWFRAQFPGGTACLCPWSGLAATLAFLVFRDRRASGVLGLLVFSHWLLDFIVHPPDLPLLLSGTPQVGLGMWSSGPGFVAATILEVALLAGGLAVYAAARRKR